MQKQLPKQFEGEGETEGPHSHAHPQDRVYDALIEKYPSLVRRKHALFQQDNAKPHTARKTSNKFEELDDVEVLPHPAYSPDVVPSDYGLFRSM